jgi:hypothetical protein
MGSIVDAVRMRGARPVHAASSSTGAHETGSDRAANATAATAWYVLAACAIVAGVYLRVTQLPIQILLDDEWHAIHEILHADVRGIVTSFGLADYSIPLTLYYRFLALHGGLTEWEMHVPPLVAGLAFLVIGPLLLRRQASPAVLATWMVLLATSPLHVYLSRTARPYALTCLLAFMAVIAFRNARLEPARRRAWDAVYVVATVLSGWLHLVTLPFTLLPFLHYALLSLARERDGARWVSLRTLAWLGVATALPLAGVLVPPLLGSRAQLIAKAGTDSLTLESVYRTVLMLYGSGSPWVSIVGAALAAAGVRRWWRRDAGFVAYVAFVCLGAAVAIAAARPQWIHHPLVLARYLLPALPFLLLFASEGAIAAVGSMPGALRVPSIAMGALALFAAGPIPGYLYDPNQFMGHQRFQFDYDPAHNPYETQIPREPVPAFYRTLARQAPQSLTLIEAPWRLESNFIPHPWYQQVHRQYVKIGLVTPTCGVRDFGEYPASVTSLRFRYFVHLSDILDGRATGADYLVMHLVPWKIPPDAQVEWPDVAACLPKIEAVLGAPTYRDERIVVFDLAQHALRH